GLHPDLKRLKASYDAGRLAIVEGCGYPDPIRSHFKSMEVWHTARARGRSSGSGWIGRLCEVAGGDAAAEFVVHVGPNVPYSVYSGTHPAVSFVTPEGYRWVATDAQDLVAYRDAGTAEPSKAGSTSTGSPEATGPSARLVRSETVGTAAKPKKP